MRDAVSLPQAVEGEEPVHHLFVTRSEGPDALAARLSEAGIAARSYYRVPVHRQPAMAAWAPDGELPGTQQAALSNLALPMGPTLGRETATAVANALPNSR